MGSWARPGTPRRRTCISRCGWGPGSRAERRSTPPRCCAAGPLLDVQLEAARHAARLGLERADEVAERPGDDAHAALTLALRDLVHDRASVGGHDERPLR